MSFSRPLLACIACLISLSISAQADDLKIVSRQSLGPNDTITSTQYFSGSSWRQEMEKGTDNVRGHHLATIVQHGDSTNEQFVLDFDAREYVEYTVDKRGIRIGSKSVLGPANRAGSVDVWIESTDTGERQQMFGQTARHIITKERSVPASGSCSGSSESETDGWYIDYSAFPEWRRPSSRAVGFAVAAGCRAKFQVHRSGVELGFPMKFTTTLRQQMPAPDARVLSSSNTWEVVEFSTAPLDPALFVVPADFRRVDELTNMNQPRNLTAWEIFKNWLGEIFR